MTTPQTWHVPGRVNLIGEHLDYNGGPVLPMAIDLRLTVTVEPRDDGVVTIDSDSAPSRATFPVDADKGDVDGWATYAAGAVWSARQAGHTFPGARVDVRSTIPVGAGLSSSAALTCGLIAALGDMFGWDLDGTETAVLAQRAESEYVGAPVGMMDQLAIVHGRAGHALLIDTSIAPPSHTSVPVSWEQDGLELVVVNTNAHHSLADGQYAARRRECEAAAVATRHRWLADAHLDDLSRLDDPVVRRRARHVVTETARVHDAVEAIGSRAWGRLGSLLQASHVSMRDDFEISCPELDVAVDTAGAHGALGARMTGGGFGGSAIALAPAAATASIGSAVESAFADRGWTAPDVFVVRPAPGARRRD